MSDVSSNATQSSGGDSVIAMIFNYLSLLLLLGVGIAGAIAADGLALRGFFASVIPLSLFWLITGGKASSKGKLSWVPGKVKGEFLAYVTGIMNLQGLILVLVCCALGYGTMALIIQFA